MEGDTQPDQATNPTLETVPQEPVERTGLFYRSQRAQEPVEDDTGESDPIPQGKAETPPAASEEASEPTNDIEPTGEAADPSQTAGTEEESEEPIRSFSELVESQGWDPEWANSLTLTKKVDGETREVTIGELLRVDQTLDAATKRLEESKEKSKAILAEADGERQEAAKKLAESAAVLTFLEDFLGLKNAEQTLQKIRQEKGDTAYLVEKDRLEALQGQLGKLRNYTSEAMTEFLNRQGGMSETEMAEAAEQGHQKLLEMIPEWKDNPDLQQSEVKEMVSYAQEMGYSDDQIQQTLDPNLWNMLRKAMLYDRSKAAAKQTEKVVKKIPTMRPSATNPKKEDKKRDRVSTFYGNSGQN